MKKYLLLSILFLLPFFAFAENTNSIDLEYDFEHYLQASDSASLSITGDLTIEAWIKLEQLPSSIPYSFSIVAKQVASDDLSYMFGIYSANDKPYIQYSADGGAVNTTWVFSDNAFTGADVGNWVHIAVVVDVSSPATPIFYKNGVALSGLIVNQADATSINDGIGNFDVGAKENTPPHYFFDGKIDDVRIWSDIRTPAEVFDNYDLELVGSEVNLEAYWKLNDDLLDETLNDNTLTAMNGADFSSPPDFAFESEPPEPPPTGTMIRNFTLASSSDVMASVGTLFTDLWLIIAMVIGIPLAFYAIQRTIKLIPADEKVKK